MKKQEQSIKAQVIATEHELAVAIHELVATHELVTVEHELVNEQFQRMAVCEEHLLQEVPNDKQLLVVVTDGIQAKVIKYRLAIVGDLPRVFADKLLMVDV